MPAALGEGLLRLRRTRVRFPPPPRVLRRKREHRWRCADAVVAVEDLPGPANGIAHTNARRLRPGPQFQILRTVVVAHSIAVVHSLALNQETAQQFFCNKDVFKHVVVPSRARMTRDTYHDVPSLVPYSATFPIPVGPSSVALAAATRLRPQLLRTATRTKVLRPARWTPKVSTGWPKHTLALLAPSTPHEATVLKGCDSDAQRRSSRSSTPSRGSPCRPAGLQH
jgi:hypothetical protein